MSPQDALDDDALVDDETLAVLGSTIDWAWQRIRGLPATDVPRSLVPMLGFRRLSSAARRQIVRALDEDDAFRAAVAPNVDHNDLPAVGLLWLQRPEGWAGRFEAMRRDVLARNREIEHVEQERRARAEIERLESALTKALRERDRAVKRGAEARTRFDELRASRDEIRTERNALRRRTADLENERRRAVEELQAARALADRRLEELKALQDQLGHDRPERSEAEPDQDQPPLAESPSETAGTELVGSDRAGLSTAELEAAIDLGRRRTQEALEASLAATAAELVERVNDGFGELFGALQGAESPRTRSPRGSDKSAAKRSATPNEAKRSRQRLKLPGGVFDDSTEAAAWLLTAADVWLIDGYNVTMAQWPDDTVTHQRDWLVRRLDRVATETTMRVIFDGADGDYFRASGERRRTQGVHVEFSPVGVEADDVIVELCATLPAGLSIVVVSNDRRVQTGARRHGANIVTVEQLLSISGRE